LHQFDLVCFVHLSSAGLPSEGPNGRFPMNLTIVVAVSSKPWPNRGKNLLSVNLTFAANTCLLRADSLACGPPLSKELEAASPRGLRLGGCTECHAPRRCRQSETGDGDNLNVTKVTFWHLCHCEILMLAEPLLWHWFCERICTYLHPPPLEAASACTTLGFTFSEHRNALSKSAYHALDHFLLPSKLPI
jgi:hypothetical protein